MRWKYHESVKFQDCSSNIIRRAERRNQPESIGSKRILKKCAHWVPAETSAVEKKNKFS